MYEHICDKNVSGPLWFMLLMRDHAMDEVALTAFGREGTFMRNLYISFSTFLLQPANDFPGTAKVSPAHAHKPWEESLRGVPRTKEEKEKRRKFEVANHLGDWHILTLGHTNNRTRYEEVKEVKEDVKEGERKVKEVKEGG